MKLSPDIEVYIKFQTYKGWFYIVITAMLVYALSKVYANHKDKALTLSREKERIVSNNLKEREILIKEIQHRVKNNLQIIISLIRLKRRYLSDVHDSEILKEIIDKIHAIALVHEILDQEDLLSEVNFKLFILKLIKYLGVSLESRNRVKILLDLDTIILPLDMAVPCGILINEIITNILKYAFPNKMEGEISFKLKQKDEKITLLQIKDNGIGIDPSAPVEKDHALGMRLIHALSDQLNAGIKIISEKTGTTYTLTLNLSTLNV